MKNKKIVGHNKWLLTERTNILLSGGTLILVSTLLMNLEWFNNLGGGIMLSGLWIMVFYKQEYKGKETK